ncbi:enoyl-CoA hydratase/isomerase family protein [bacterium]|nr:enoyl-CoA hydratase/isomerase family protein [bacterium]
MADSRGFRIVEESWDNRQIVRLVFESPDRPVNVLTPEVMSALEEALSRFQRNLPSALILESALPDVFIAGADIHVIEKIRNEDEARKLSREGQDILIKLHSIPCPTFAAIDGATLGGGLEVAMFCDYRIVSDNPKARLGLPEVSLGIIPGFGGTQTLPRLVGFQAALDLILTGRQIDGRRAKKLGLADSCVPRGIFAGEVRSFVLKHPKKHFGPRHSPPMFLFREIGCSLAKRSVLKKTMGNYPAPLRAIEAVRRGISRPLSEGLKIEADLFAQLPQTRESRNLVRTYFQVEKFKKLTLPHLEEKQRWAKSHAMPRTCAVIGAGTMGAGIAYQLASAGLSVRLKDVEPKFIQRGLAAADKIVKGLLKKKRLSPEEARDILGRILPTLDAAPLRSAGVVIEAVIEDLPLKRKVFDDLEKAAPAGAILATNTSSIPIGKIAADRELSGRYVGLHFFNPVDKMPLVEVVVGENTSDETTAFAIEFAKKIRKTPIVVRDRPGFLVNRLLMPYLNEAALLLSEGAQTARIDRTARQFGMPMGPLMLLDVVGLDVAEKVAEVLEDAYGERMKPCSVIGRLRKEGRLGQKNGTGFYTHSGKSSDPDESLHAAGGPAAGMSWEEMIDRMILCMVNEAARALEEGIVADAETLDVGMLLGTGFPPFRGGLLKYADDRGIPVIVSRLYTFSEKYGMRFAPAPILADMARSGARFHPIA